MKVGLGTGQRRSPFSLLRTDFDAICREYEFCPEFLRRLREKTPMFEHHFGFVTTGTGSSKTPTHLEIALSNYENDAFLCLLRYKIGNLGPNSVKCLLFLKDTDSLKNNTKQRLDLDGVELWLDEHQELLDRHPLLCINVVLALLQDRAHEPVRWRQNLNDIEARLGVSRDLESLRRSGYPKVSYDFNALNADLADIAKKIADNELSAATIVEHARTLQRVVRICEEYEKVVAGAQTSAQNDITSEQYEEIQSTITRGELYLQNVKMTQNMLQSLTAVLYNRINKNDTQSMKTIAVVTLFFLPATFVSAIFSTGVFNFHAGEPSDGARVLSPYSWIYLLTCLLLTFLTLVLWVCWYAWGRFWFDKLRQPQGKR